MPRTDEAILSDIMIDEYEYGREAGKQDAAAEIYDPGSNPWLPPYSRHERDRAAAWADGYVQGFTHADRGLWA